MRTNLQGSGFFLKIKFNLLPHSLGAQSSGIVQEKRNLILLLQNLPHSSSEQEVSEVKSLDFIFEVNGSNARARVLTSHVVFL
jgi:hypothetical protein